MTPATDKQAFLRASRAPCGAGRRGCLRRALAVVGLLCLQRAGARPALPPVAALPALDDWLQRANPAGLSDPEAMRHVGALYLAGHPDESDPARLWQRFADGGAAAGAEGLAARIDQDWRSGDVVLVSGWVFARTEARCCALLHHRAGAAP